MLLPHSVQTSMRSLLFPSCRSLPALQQRNQVLSDLGLQQNPQTSSLTVRLRSTKGQIRCLPPRHPLLPSSVGGKDPTPQRTLWSKTFSACNCRLLHPQHMTVYPYKEALLPPKPIRTRSALPQLLYHLQLIQAVGQI